MSRKRKVVFGLAALPSLYLAIALLRPQTFVAEYDKIETLVDPVAVTGWSGDGLSLADGRLATLPGVSTLPTASEALARATKRGVEITPDGRVIGLVRVHHWCGADPVRAHLARVDLAHLLIFLRQAEFDLTWTTTSW